MACAGLFGALVASGLAWGAEGFQVLRLPDGAAPLRIDGRLDEAAWAQAAPYDHFEQQSPRAGAPLPAGVRTEVRVLADGHALVFGIRAWSPQPPRRRLTRRDGVDRDQDFIGVWIDTAGRGGAALFVKASLDGVVTDGLYKADEDSEDLGPSHPVQVAAQVLPDGYTMEIRWPLAALRYGYALPRPWALLVGRAVPALGDLWLVSGKADLTAVSALQAARPMGGLDAVLRDHRTRSEGEAVVEATLRRTAEGGRIDREQRLGVEAWWRPRAGWLLNGTFMPDFAQVEIDAPQTRRNPALALELPEKRRYFLESADVLGLPTSAFYSRTVADPRWGLRGTWRGEDADAAGLLVDDRAGATVLRGRPYATEAWTLTAPSTVQLLRGRRAGSAGTDSTSAGVWMARRAMEGAGSNTVVGHDGQWRRHRAGENLKARWQWMASEHDLSVDPEGQVLPGRAPRERGWQGQGDVTYSGERWIAHLDLRATSPGFVNLLGFSDQAGLARGEVELSRRFGERQLPAWLGGATLDQTELFFSWDEQQTLSDAPRGQPGGEVMRRQRRLGTWFAGPLRSEGWALFGADQQRADALGVLHEVPAVTVGGGLNPWPGQGRVNGEVSIGRLLDVARDRVGDGGWWTFGAQGRWTLPNAWVLEVDPSVNGQFIGASSGFAAVRDSGWRVLTWLHRDAHSGLRLIVQGSQQQADGRVQSQRHQSLLWRQRFEGRWSLNVGWQQDERSGAPKRREVFLKLQTHWDGAGR